MEIKNIYNDLRQLEDKLWKVEKQLNKGYLKDRVFEIRFNLIKVLLRIRELI